MKLLLRTATLTSVALVLASGPTMAGKFDRGLTPIFNEVAEKRNTLSPVFNEAASVKKTEVVKVDSSTANFSPPPPNFKVDTEKLTPKDIDLVRNTLPRPRGPNPPEPK